MKVTNSELIYEAEQNYVRAQIWADEVPSPLPTPADIPGCDSSWKFTPDSILMIASTGAMYFAGEDNSWYQQ